MPFVSDDQRKWGNSPAGLKALGGHAKVSEWNQSTKGRDLPKRIHKTAMTNGTGSSMPKKMPKHGAGHYMSTFGSLAPGGDDDT